MTCSYENALRLAEEALTKNGFTKIDDVWVAPTIDDMPPLPKPDVNSGLVVYRPGAPAEFYSKAAMELRDAQWRVRLLQGPRQDRGVKPHMMHGAIGKVLRRRDDEDLVHVETDLGIWVATASPNVEVGQTVCLWYDRTLTAIPQSVEVVRHTSAAETVHLKTPLYVEDLLAVLEDAGVVVNVPSYVNTQQLFDPSAVINRLKELIKG